MSLCTDPEQLASEYERIESTFAKVSDLLKVSAQDNGEKLVAIDTRTGIVSGYRGKADMSHVLKGIIHVREGVYQRLLVAHAELRGMDRDLTFDVRYGYRLDEIQQGYYARSLATVEAYAKEHGCDWSSEEIRDRAHWYAAFPEVAGHPTGGAVDLTLFNRRLCANMDMGMGVAGTGPLNRKIYYASPEISEEAAQNRKVLRESMESAGFHGFAGEYWHHSYGDREWAFHVGAPVALYSPLSLSQAEALMRT